MKGWRLGSCWLPRWGSIPPSVYPIWSFQNLVSTLNGQKLWCFEHACYLESPHEYELKSTKESESTTPDGELTDYCQSHLTDTKPVMKHFGISSSTAAKPASNLFVEQENSKNVETVGLATHVKWSPLEKKWWKHSVTLSTYWQMLMFFWSQKVVHLLSGSIFWRVRSFSVSVVPVAPVSWKKPRNKTTVFSCGNDEISVGFSVRWHFCTHKILRGKRYIYLHWCHKNQAFRNPSLGLVGETKRRTRRRDRWGEKCRIDKSLCFQIAFE